MNPLAPSIFPVTPYLLLYFGNVGLSAPALINAKVTPDLAVTSTAADVFAKTPIPLTDLPHYS